MRLRRALHRMGLRYRLHDRALPGSPDLVFPRFRAAVFVHGCYWHVHGCYRSTVPKTRKEFWTKKFDANRARDERNVACLRVKEWRILTVWECALAGRTAMPAEQVAQDVEAWLTGDEMTGEIGGADLQR